MIIGVCSLACTFVPVQEGWLIHTYSPYTKKVISIALMPRGTMRSYNTVGDQLLTCSIAKKRDIVTCYPYKEPVFEHQRESVMRHIIIQWDREQYEYLSKE